MSFVKSCYTVSVYLWALFLVLVFCVSLDSWPLPAFWTVHEPVLPASTSACFHYELLDCPLFNCMPEFMSACVWAEIKCCTWIRQPLSVRYNYDWHMTNCFVHFFDKSVLNIVCSLFFLYFFVIVINNNEITSENLTI